jgi:cation transport ATPase
MKQLFPSTTGGIELFDEFFDSGLEESVSPFLFPHSRKWGINLSLKASLAAAFLLLFAYIFSFYPKSQHAADFFLLFTFFLAGIPALIASVEDLVNFEINIDVLMTLAAFLSILIGSGSACKSQGGPSLLEKAFASKGFCCRSGWLHARAFGQRYWCGNKHPCQSRPNCPP